MSELPINNSYLPANFQNIDNIVDEEVPISATPLQRKVVNNRVSLTRKNNFGSAKSGSSKNVLLDCKTSK